MLQRSILTTILNYEILKILFFKIKNKEVTSLLELLFNIILELLAKTIRQRKEI